MNKYIGWFSSRTGSIELNNLETTLNRIMKGHKGELYTYYVKNEKQQLRGMVFVSEKITQNEANNYFNEKIKEVIKR